MTFHRIGDGIMPAPLRSALAVLVGSGLLAFGRTPATTLEAQNAPPPPPATASQVQKGVTLSVANSPVLGAYVTDAKGRALYVFESKGTAGGCFEVCLVVWPPLVAGPGSLEAADSSLTRSLGSEKRRDGLTQATYAGHPLYYYIADRGPGQTLGQDVEDSWGEWHLGSPAGSRVRHADRRRDEDRRGRDD